MIKEDEINCKECSHKEVCKRYLDSYKALITTEKTFDDIGKKIGDNCKNFRYKKMDYYTLEDYKELIKKRVDNCKNVRHLLIIGEILKLEEPNEKIQT